MTIPEDLLYTKEHEWIRLDNDIGTIGITDYAQHALGDVTFIDPPKSGQEIQQSAILATIESVKAASDIYAPLSGKVLEVNDQLDTNPGLVNQSCYDKGWIARIKIKNHDEKKTLMTSAAYQKYVEGLTT